MSKSEREQQDKLAILQRRFELEERGKFEEKRKIDLVVEERDAIVRMLSMQAQSLRDKLKNLKGRARTGAALSGNIARLGDLERFRVRIQAELENVDLEIAERSNELQTAKERAKLAEQELVAARLEKKRVERLLERREHSVRISAEARDEVLSDEMSFYTRKR